MMDFFLARDSARTRDLQDFQGKKRASGRGVRRPFSAKARLKKSPSMAYSAVWQRFKYWQLDQ
jgi:hypothetical protein